MANSIYEIAYQEAVRAITEQRASVESLRSRALTMFAIAISSNAFLGGIALEDGDPHGLAWAALGVLVVLGVLVLRILWPRRFVFLTSPRLLIANYADSEPAADVPTTFRDISLHIERYYSQNEIGLSRMSALIQVGTALLIGRTILWLIVLS
jgi:hypothetical protein